MGALGTTSLLLGMVLALYATVGSVAGVRLGLPHLVTSARRAAYLTGAVAAVAAGVLVHAFITNDFSLAYVYGHSSRAMERAYVWVAFYAGNEGSLLYITVASCGMAAAAIRFSPKSFAAGRAYATAILMAMASFFFLVLIAWADPFEPLAFAATDGIGLNPLLAHPGMFFHPPLLMAGLVGIAIPFAYVIGSLMSGATGDEWLDHTRVSVIVVWAMLGAGILLGAWWAYTILGWGGYWGWDPIENAALMPWLTMTALIHSMRVQKRRGMFRAWNIVLVNISFVLSLFGMFINRGGPVVSVHSFGATQLGFVFLGFMLVGLLFGFAVFFRRYPVLRSDRPLKSFLSREASFLLNNFLLLGITAVTLWGVIFSILSEYVRSTTVTVSAPFFEGFNGPLLLALLLLMGVGPVLPWARSTGRSLRRWLVFPAVVGLLTTSFLFAIGHSKPVAASSLGVVAFVAAAIAEEWYRSLRARRRGGDGWVSGFVHMVRANRPRHGGYVVHISMLLIAIGVIGTSFYEQQTDVALAPGESVEIGRYRLEFTGADGALRGDRDARWANITVFEGDRRIGTLQPWLAFYPAFEQVSVRAAIRSTPVEDLYVVPIEFLADGRVVLRVSVNPLAWWLWAAGPVFLVGTLIALWPRAAVEAAPAPAMAGTGAARPGVED